MSADKAKLIRLKDVISISGLKRATIYSYISKGLFPLQITLGERIVAWIETEILAVNQARIAGKTEQEIQNLVSQLKIQRQQISLQ
jgi:prophage regulatory protein